MNYLRIILNCIGAAILYGVVHDQFTARICVEYFTIGHPPVFNTESPTLLALGWGVIATWWVGALIGVPLSIAARAGHRAKLSAPSLVKPIFLLLLVMAGCATIAGVAGYALARRGAVFLIGPMADAIPGEKHVAFLADLWAHSASYAAGFLGGIVLIIRTWRSRTPKLEP